MADRVSPAAAMDALRRIVRGLRLAARTTEQAFGVSAAQLFVLQRLAERPGASLSELAALTETDPSSVSVVVARLVERRLIVRRAAAADARRAELTLTAKGRALTQRAPEPVQARFIKALQRLPPARLAALTRGLEVLVAELGASPDKKAPMFFEEEVAPRTPARRRRS